MRSTAAALFALSGLAFVAIAAVLLAAPPGWSIGALVGDDAGYYFAIARNACLGHGFSFDRIHATNGFNPLFPWLLIPLDRLIGHGLPLLACYRAGLLVSVLAMAGAWGAFLRLMAARLASDGWPGETRGLALAAASAFFVMFVGAKGYYGMDAPLVLLLGLLYFVRVNRGGPLAPGARAAVVDGLLLALLFLARVDTLPLIAAAVAWMAVEAVTRRRGAGALLARLAIVAVGVAPYLLWSTARFGTWLPVSARIKSAFPVIDLARSLGTIRHTSLAPQDQLSFLVAWLLAWGTLAVLAPRIVRALRDRLPLAPATSALGLFALYLAGRLSFMLLFSRADVQGSYAVLAHVFNLLVASARLGAWMRGRTPAVARRAAAWASLALALLALTLFAGKLEGSWRRERTAAAQGLPDEAAFGAEIHAHTEDGDVLFGGSFGLLGFFADRPWINGDGVVNTYDYQRMFLAGEDALGGYLSANRVTHVVFELPRGEAPAAPFHFTAFGLLYDRRGSIPLAAQDIVLRRPVARGPAEGEDVLLVRVRE